MTNILFAVVVIIFLGGCATPTPFVTASPELELESKTLKPTNQLALIYFCHAKFNEDGSIQPPPVSYSNQAWHFTVEEVKVGELPPSHYLYFYAYPGQLQLPKHKVERAKWNRDGGTWVSGTNWGGASQGGNGTFGNAIMSSYKPNFKQPDIEYHLDGFTETKIEAGKVYFFQFLPSKGYTHVPDEIGRTYLEKQKLIGDLSKAIVGSPNNPNQVMVGHNRK